MRLHLQCNDLVSASSINKCFDQVMHFSMSYRPDNEGTSYQHSTSLSQAMTISQASPTTQPTQVILGKPDEQYNIMQEILSPEASRILKYLEQHEIICYFSMDPLPVSSSCFHDETLRRRLHGFPIQIRDTTASSMEDHLKGILLVRMMVSNERCKLVPVDIPLTLQCSFSDDQTIILCGKQICGERQRQPILESSKWDVQYQMSLLEANIDDMTAEHLAFCADRLIGNPGVADCWRSNIIMKKGRAAHTLHCLVANAHVESVLECIFRWTTTLGIRVQNNATGLSRVALRRCMVNHDSIACKVAYLANEVVSVKAEFDDCQANAIATGQSISDISRAAEHAVRIKLEEEAS